MNPPQKPASKSPAPQPTWWSPKAALGLAFGFAAVAGFPYLASTTRLLAEGKPVTIAAVKDETKKDMMKKEKEHHEHDAKKQREIKSMTVAADGTLYAGGHAGVLRWKDGAWEKLPGFEDEEAKSIVSAPDGSLLVAGKHAAWKHKDGAWSKVYDGDTHSISQAADGTLFVAGPKVGLKKKAPGGEWEMVSEGFEGK